MMNCYDLHCHLGFAADPRAAADDLARRGIACLSASVTPDDYRRSAAQLAGCDHVRLAVGLHPWWIADGSCGEQQLADLEELLAPARYVGEVGLDFAGGRNASAQEQIDAFERIARICASGDKLITIHAVQAGTVLLDILERYDLPSCNTCLLHWFSGSAEELTRAIRMGCFFSVGPRMLASKRGRAYAQIIPAERLVLESDLPSSKEDEFSGAAIEAALQEALDCLAKIRGEDLSEKILATSKALLLMDEEGRADDR